MSAQLQQQLAQRAANQAESRAQTLKSEAEAAQAEANRSQENARALRVESDQAQSEAGSARQNVVSLKAAEGLQTRFGEWRAQIATALETLSGNAASAASSTAKPVVNADGQMTGTVVSVTA